MTDRIFITVVLNHFMLLIRYFGLRFGKAMNKRTSQDKRNTSLIVSINSVFYQSYLVFQDF